MTELPTPGVGSRWPSLATLAVSENPAAATTAALSLGFAEVAIVQRGSECVDLAVSVSWRFSHDGGNCDADDLTPTTSIVDGKQIAYGPYFRKFPFVHVFSVPY